MIVFKNCLFKNEEVSTNDADIFTIIRPKVFHKIDVLKGFVTFSGKHLYWSFFFNEIAGLAYKFITKETPTQA